MKRMILLLILLLFVALGVLGCRKPTAPSPARTDLRGQQILMIIAHRDFRDEEYREPRKVFEENGARVIVASSSLDVAKGALGAEVKPDIALDQVEVADYQAIVFVGGPGATEYWDNPTAYVVAQQAVGRGKVLGAICIAPATLAKAGVLKGKKATVFSSAKGELETAGAVYTGQAVERDGLIITANGPAAASEFAQEIVRALAEKK